MKTIPWQELLNPLSNFKFSVPLTIPGAVVVTMSLTTPSSITEGLQSFFGTPNINKENTQVVVKGEEPGTSHNLDQQLTIFAKLSLL